MPKKQDMKCYFGCKTEGPFHRFPKPEYPSMDRYNLWKAVLAPAVQNKGDSYIYNNIRICDSHFEDNYRLRSRRLTRTAIPTLNIHQTMPIQLFYTPLSAPCRIVLLTAAALNIQLDLKLVDLNAKDHHKPEFLKMNPQHTVPTIKDGDFTLWESRAISRYLVNKYGVDSSLYPQDPVTRAIIDQRMDFDLGSLYPRFAAYFYPQVFGGAAPDPEKKEKVEEALGFMNSFLEGHIYAVGSELTLADLSLLASVSTMEASDINFKVYPNVKRWYELVKSSVPNYEEANGSGVQATKDLVAMMKRTEL